MFLGYFLDNVSQIFTTFKLTYSTRYFISLFELLNLFVLELLLIYCTLLHLKVIDRIIQEMENRFSEANSELLTCISCLDPTDLFSKFDYVKVLRLAELYPKDFTDVELYELKDQLGVWIYDMRVQENFVGMENIVDVVKVMVQVII